MDALTCGLFTVCWYVFASAVTPEGHTEMEVVAGQDVLLDCQSLKDGITLLEWIRPDLESDGYVFFYREQRSYEKYQHPHFHGRVKLADPLMKNGNMSVILTNTQPDKDDGIYQCCVSAGFGRTAPSEIRQIIKLKVSPANLGQTEKLIGNGGDKDGGDKVGGDKDGGDKDGGEKVEGDKDGFRRRNGLIVSLSLTAVMMFVVFAVIRKRCVLIPKEHMRLSKRKRKVLEPPDEAETHRDDQTNT